ncbi:MAG: winged helix-turn-helix domain-containing protein [Eggerthellaceae bacterium]
MRNEEALSDEKTINTHVSNIRTKLKGTGTEGYIETVWGIGFKLSEGD